jgi:MFS family permease
MGTSTALTSTVFQPCCASISDVLGRRYALTLSAAFLAFGSCLAAVSPNYASIIAARSLQGIGAGGISAITDVIVTDIVPLRSRGKYFAFISVPWAIGTAIGPIISGVLAKDNLWVTLVPLHAFSITTNGLTEMDFCNQSYHQCYCYCSVPGDTSYFASRPSVII